MGKNGGPDYSTAAKPNDLYGDPTERVPGSSLKNSLSMSGTHIPMIWGGSEGGMDRRVNTLLGFSLILTHAINQSIKT